MDIVSGIESCCANAPVKSIFEYKVCTALSSCCEGYRAGHTGDGANDSLVTYVSETVTSVSIGLEVA